MAEHGEEVVIMLQNIQKKVEAECEKEEYTPDVEEPEERHGRMGDLLDEAAQLLKRIGDPYEKAIEDSMASLADREEIYYGELRPDEGGEEDRGWKETYHAPTYRGAAQPVDDMKDLDAESVDTIPEDDDDYLQENLKKATTQMIHMIVIRKNSMGEILRCTIRKCGIEYSSGILIMVSCQPWHTAPSTNSIIRQRGQDATPFSCITQ